MQYQSHPFLLVYSLIALVKSTLVILVYGVHNIIMLSEQTVDHEQNGYQWLPQCIAYRYLGITKEAFKFDKLTKSLWFIKFYDH